MREEQLDQRLQNASKFQFTVVFTMHIDDLVDTLQRREEMQRLPLPKALEELFREKLSIAYVNGILQGRFLIVAGPTVQI